MSYSALDPKKVPLITMPSSVIIRLVVNLRVRSGLLTNRCHFLNVAARAAYGRTVNANENWIHSPGSGCVRRTNCVIIPNPAAAPRHAQNMSVFCVEEARTMELSARTTSISSI